MPHKFNKETRIYKDLHLCRQTHKETCEDLDMHRQTER